VGQGPGRVPARRRERQECEALEAAEAGGKESGREEHDEGGGDGEEARQADVPAAVKDGPADGRRERHPRHPADHAGPARRALGLGHDAPEKEDGLRALAEDAGEGDEPPDPQPIARPRLVDAMLDLSLHEPGMLLHPPRVPGEQSHGGEDDDHRDDVGAQIEQGAGEEGHGDAHGHAQQQADRPAPRHKPEAVAGPDLLEIGVDDAEEEGGLEGLAQGDDEGCAQGVLGIYSATMVALAVSEWYSPTKGYLPGLRAGILRRTVLPPGMTFSMRGCCMSSSSGPLSLLVMTRTNDCPALTLMTSGWKRFFSMTRGISGAD